MSRPPAPSSGVRLTLPTFDRHRAHRPLELRAPGAWTRPVAPITSRVAFAAAHVVPTTDADNTPGTPATVDWDTTLAYRHRIWEYGLGVAEAMDTAQRGMGLDWGATRELVRRSSAEARAVGGSIACGAGTDQLDAGTLSGGPGDLQRVVDAYREQVAVVSEAGAQVIVMASRALVRAARSAEDYLHVYDAVLAEVDRPVILHWLGPMFDPALEGYWGTTDVATATQTVLDLIAAHRPAVDGIKVSLLDKAHEVDLRARLADLPGDGPRVRLYTGDDLSYPELIAGGGGHHSDALLGVFAAIFPAASTALQAFDAGDMDGGTAILRSTEPLGRLMFAAPTQYYKTGVAFLSWLNGFQPGFQMVGGLHSGRSARHLVELFRVADAAGLLLDPARAAQRMAAFLEVNGLAA